MSAIVPTDRLLSAKELALLLGFGGARPEKAVYEMVADGRIPRECVVRISECRYKFHPVRIQKLIDEGGFVRSAGGRELGATIQEEG